MAVIEGWNATHAKALHALIQRASVEIDAAENWGRLAALHTGGLPVYCDMGGCLVITPLGDVLEYAFEGAIVTPVTDRSSIRLARAAAAEKYDLLADLMPTDGIRCTTCSGTGKLGPLQLRCGLCEGTGLMAKE